MGDFVYSILDLMWFPFSNFDLPIMVLPFGFAIFCAVFALIKRMGGL